MYTLRDLALRSSRSPAASRKYPRDHAVLLPCHPIVSSCCVLLQFPNACAVVCHAPKSAVNFASLSSSLLSHTASALARLSARVHAFCCSCLPSSPFLHPLRRRLRALFATSSYYACPTPLPSIIASPPLPDAPPFPSCVAVEVSRFSRRKIPLVLSSTALDQSRVLTISLPRAD